MLGRSNLTSGAGRASRAMQARDREEALHAKRLARAKEEAADAAPAVPVPSPTERPTRRAQWDELRACWVEWDAELDDWRVVGGAAEGDEAAD